MNETAVPTKQSSARREWRNLALLLLFMLGLFGLAFFDDSSRSATSVGVSFAIAYTIGLFWLIRAFVEWIRADSKPLTAGELKEFQHHLHNSAPARYSLAIMVVCGAIFIADAKPNEWWIAAVLALWAAILAREITILLIVIGGAYFLFLGIASLPVSIAVIIGALIIAAAVRK